MAIMMQQVFEATEDEKKRLEAVEVKIDGLLTRTFRQNGCVWYPIGKRWRPGFIAVLLRRYREAGWCVDQGNDAKDRWCLKFTQPCSLDLAVPSSEESDFDAS